ncbi:MAG TPA: ribose-5-phosphate isomerase RpiA [Candidatus Binataceae bacterium]|nr:ribose-5-phosphate isomerase RpiA [Candidatus Binataceae bacterium]
MASKATSSRSAAAVKQPPGDLEALAAYALRYVRPGYTLGLGTGRAASAFITALGRKRMAVRGVPTSKASEALARSLGIEVVSLGDVKSIDVDFDGADEVDPRLNLIKGYGGALLREKVVARASRRRIILVGSEKLVARLGDRGRLPVEVVPFAVAPVMREIARLGLRPRIRMTPQGDEALTDNGNLLLDCATRSIANPARLERDLAAIAGVAGSGLFVGIADIVLVATPQGAVNVMKRRSRA